MISVLCPVYNEEKFIEQLLLFFLQAQPIEKELLIIDGGSNDRTVEIIESYSCIHQNIYILKNPQRYVPYALNKAITEAKGDIIIRLDAHTNYALDYLSQILSVFRKTDADIVGGPMRAVGKTSFQKAVAIATSTKLGVGNSQFHFDDFNGYTDSVYLGAWKKSIFEITGLFDEQLKRNQDDEFHYRAKSLGFKIFQSSQIRSYYYPRSSPLKLFKQYFEYGLYKPLVIKKVKSEIKVRHLVPMAFVIYITGLCFVNYWFCWVPLFIYFVMAAFFAIKAKKSLSVASGIFIVFPIIHFAYGLGFISGLGKVFRSASRNTRRELIQSV